MTSPAGASKVSQGLDVICVRIHAPPTHASLVVPVLGKVFTLCALVLQHDKGRNVSLTRPMPVMITHVGMVALARQRWKAVSSVCVGQDTVVTSVS